jgi:hypothetical protein
MKVQKEMRMRLKVGLLSAALLVAATAARADLVVQLGNYQLQPGQAGQIVPIFVAAQGGEAVAGTEFRVQEGDGGTDLGGSDVAPSMVGDIIGPGTIFELNNSGVNDSSFPMLVALGTTTSSGFNILSAGDNLWGTLTFDTTGLTSGSWPLIMTGTIFGDSGLNPFQVGDGLTILNGTVTIVPEPSSVVLGMFAVAGLGAVAIRRRRARNA